MQKSIIISLGLLLIWSDNRVTSNPVSADAVKSPWVSVESGHQKLKPSQLLLVNKTLNPFLEDCYSAICCSKSSQFLCPSYYEMILLVNNSKQLENLTANEVKQLQTTTESMEDVEDVEKFCRNFSKSLASLTFQQWDFDIREHIQKTSFCRILCFKDEISPKNMKPVFILKPVCKMISFMANIIANETVVNTINSNVVSGDTKIEDNKVKYNGTTSEQVAKSNPIAPVAPAAPAVPAAPAPDSEHKEIATTTQIAAGNKQQQIQEVIKNKISEKLPAVNISSSDKINHDQVFTAQKLPLKDSQMPNVPKVAENHDQNVKMKEPPAQQQPPPQQQSASHNDDLQNPMDITNEDAKSTQVDKNQEDGGLPGYPPKDIINESKIQIEQQGNDGNFDINNPDDPDIDGLNGYDDDPEPPPQPDTKQLSDKQPKEPTTAEIMEKVSNDMLQKTGTNYIPASDPFYEEAGSNFFTYLLAGMFICILLYVLYHNKTKVLALILEGRRSQKSRGGRRKHTAQYRKLDTNLEEAITSSASGRSTQIIY